MQNLPQIRGPEAYSAWGEKGRKEIRWARKKQEEIEKKTKRRMRRTEARWRPVTKGAEATLRELRELTLK